MKGSRLTRYLWRNDFDSEEEYENTKQYYRNLGYRVVSFACNSGCGDMSVFFRQLVKHHTDNPA